jgi:hypothetical protein
MKAHKMHVVVPDDHRMLIEFPETIRSGPVELIVLESPEREMREKGAATTARSRGSLSALANELAEDPRPFRDLSPEERSARLERVMGAGRGLMSSSDELAARKLDEVELEGRKLAR